MADGKISRTVVVTNPQGLHARPADLFVKLASQYQATIEVIKDGERVDGKSILAILTLAAVQGTQSDDRGQRPRCRGRPARVVGVGGAELRRNLNRGITTSACRSAARRKQSRADGQRR